MKPAEVVDLFWRRRPPAPYGKRRLARAVSIDDLAALARRRLPRAAWGYLEGGGEDEWTLRSNRRALEEAVLEPRVMRDVTAVETTTTVLGTTIPAPVILAPVGGARLLHHEGELAALRAAAGAGLPYSLSTLATSTIESVAQEAPSARWFQLYVWGDRATNQQLIHRARTAGYGTLVVTVDCSVRSKRERELRAGLTLPNPTLTLRSILEASLHPRWWWHFLTTDAIEFANLAQPGASAPPLADMFDGSLVWDDLDWIRDAWDGPLVLKGILTTEDARIAVDRGADAVVVSNHGGRQLDHVPATIDALPHVVAAIGDQVDVLFDSGVRRGTDILVALARGARAVLIGRAYLYGLAAAGEAGVRHALDILLDELRIAMALSGYSRVDQIFPTSPRGALTAQSAPTS